MAVPSMALLSFLLNIAHAGLKRISVLQPQRNKKLKLLHKEQIRKPEQIEALLLVQKGIVSGSPVWLN